MARLFAESNSAIRILVAEDDNFQRLALIDVLELCNYEGILFPFSQLFFLTNFLFLVTAVENGKLAKDELMKEDANYDLVLLDLMMPEMVHNSSRFLSSN